MVDARSRRRFLAGAATLPLAPLLGCLAAPEPSGSRGDCTTTVVERGDGNALRQVVARADGDRVALVVALRAGAVDDVDLIEIEGVARLPVEQGRRFPRYVGRRPLAERFVVHASVGMVDPEPVDSVTVDVRCAGTDGETKKRGGPNAAQ